MELDLELVQAFSDEAADSLAKWEEICLQLAKGAIDKETLLVDLFRIAHNLKGGSRSVGLMNYGEFIHQIEDGITLLRDGVTEVNDQTISVLLQAHKELTQWNSQLKVEPLFNPKTEELLAKFKQVFSDKTQDRTFYPAVEAKNSTQNSLSTQDCVDSVSKQGTTPGKNGEKVSSEQVFPNPKRGRGSQGSVSNETIRVASQKIDHLIQVIGELSIHQSILWHSTQQNMSLSKIYLNSLQLSQKLTKELYDQALSLRMSPLQPVFQRLERSALELSVALNRAVDITFEGGDVELDRTVLERIVDPLTHLVRNALDHGIETAEERRSKGKIEKGQVRVKARKDAFGIELQISDDGQGIDSTKVKRKAIEKGLVDPSKELQEQEVFNLLFLPGFSTAEKVTDVSGRGVGMDVVKTTIEELNGSIRIESKSNSGTVFSILLPTAVNIIEGMQVSAGGQSYVVPVNAVEEILDLHGMKTTIENDMLYRDSQVIPVVNLEAVLLGKRSKDSEHHQSLLICKRDGRQFGFLVNKILGQHQIVVRQLNEKMSGAFGILGGTIMPTGEPGLILNMNELIATYSTQFTSQERSA